LARDTIHFHGTLLRPNLNDPPGLPGDVDQRPSFLDVERQGLFGIHIFSS
jgi:hypothetical protein